MVLGLLKKDSNESDTFEVFQTIYFSSVQWNISVQKCQGKKKKKRLFYQVLLWQRKVKLSFHPKRLILVLSEMQKYPGSKNFALS